MTADGGQNLDMGPVAAGPSVFIATPMYGGMATGTYTMSIAHTPATFFKNGVGLYYSCAMNDSLVTRARNYLTSQFLSSPATHLMWIDADIGFDPVDIVRMVRADKDIVCGIYPKKEIHWREVARAAREGVPPERLSEYERSLVLNLIDKSPDRVTVDGLVEIASAGNRLHADQARRVRSLVRRCAVLCRCLDPGRRAEGVLCSEHRSRRRKQPAVRGLPLLRTGTRPRLQDLRGALGTPEPHGHIHFRQQQWRGPRRDARELSERSLK